MGSLEAQFEEFDRVYDQQLTTMVRLGTLLLGSQALAEEVVQEAFIKLHDRWCEVENPAGFVRTIVINGCRDLMRRNSVAKRNLKLISDSMQETVQTHHYMVDVLQGLEPKRRTIIVLRFYGCYKIVEIAELLDLPIGTVRSNLYRGLDQLKEELSI